MDLNNAKIRVQNYLRSAKKQPLIVDIPTKADLADITDFFKIGENRFLPAEQFCGRDGVLKLDELYAAISSSSGNVFLCNVTGFLKLFGETTAKNVLHAIATANVSGHVVLLTYQCRDHLRFSDPRIAESGRLIIVDGTPDDMCSICFISPALSDAFPHSYRGIQKAGYALETCTDATAYIATAVDKSFFPKSVCRITQLTNGYDILCDRDPQTCVVPQHFGEADQWAHALQLMGPHGNWSTIAAEHFGSARDLARVIIDYPSFDQQEKWLYFIALSIFGSSDNEYLQLAVNNTSASPELLRSIFRTILTVDKGSPEFESLYRQRKALIRGLTDALPEIVDFCKVLSVKGEDAIYYLTDLTQPEKERVIAWLDTYGANYTSEELCSILKTVYPDLAGYLSSFRFHSELLDHYFACYKYQKVINRILPAFEAVVDEQSTKMDFVSALKPRASIVDTLDATDARAFFFDALGVEYLGYIQEKCCEYGLSANISCGRCELPSLTSCNKEFVAVLASKGCPVSDIKELDHVKHHGEDSFDYEKEKTPIYLIRELEIIDELLRKIRAGIFNGQYGKAIILSDHGASRLAVLHGTENIWSMATSGEHSGRCCKISEIDSKPDAAIESSGFWVLANYDRFKGGRRANVEVHGGASIEEVAVPIIEITRKGANAEAFIVDTSRVVTLGAGDHAVVDIYVSVKSSHIAIRLDGTYYDAESTRDAYIYRVDLKNYTKKGTYSFDIVNGSETLAVGQQFEIKKKGMSEVDLFG